MLRFNGSPFAYLKPAGGFLHGNGLAINAQRTKLPENFFAFGKLVSIPQGFTDAYRAVVPSLSKTDNLRVVLCGEGTVSSTREGIGSLATVVSGEGTLTPDSELGATLSAVVVGVGSLQGTARGVGSLAVTIDAGARPSAFDIAQEVWQGQKANYNAPGTRGNALNSAGSAGDPWSTNLESGSYPPGSAGYIMLNMDPEQLANLILTDPRFLTVAKFLGLKD